MYLLFYYTDVIDLWIKALWIDVEWDPGGRLGLVIMQGLTTVCTWKNN